MAPKPTIDPAMVWVVLTGMPAAAVANSVTAAPDSAQKPPKGSSLVIFDAHGFDDSPAADERSQAHGRIADQLDPGIDLEAVVLSRCSNRAAWR